MAGFLDFAHRVWRITSPPAGPPKNPGALKFGILGAAKVVPNTLINPAALNADVVVQAVAARDKQKATAYAKKHGIPEVLETYDDIINSPSIDCVFIPLPNGLHYEWALKALTKGKHVLVEKPSVSNATEAELLFRSPVLSSSPSPPPSSPPSKAPVILEAFHYRFHPAWILFTTFLDRPNIASAKVNLVIAKALFDPATDIRFQHDLAGGALMDLCYTSSVLRAVFGAEPDECLGCTVRPRPPPHELCDEAFDASFMFPGGGIGEMHGNLLGGFLEMAAAGGEGMAVEVTHRPAVVSDESLADDEEHVRTRRVRLGNFLMSALWHRIDVVDEFVVRRKTTSSNDETGEVLRRWKTKETRKAYTLRDVGAEYAGVESQPFWPSYKYQLDAFVDRVKGRESATGAWIDGEDSIGNMKMIDMAYGKSELPVRPTSKFRYVG